MNINWAVEITRLCQLKRKLNSADPEKLWPYTLPEVGVSEEQIELAEKHISHRLPNDHRHFLKHANGWKSFFHDINLFGTGDLQGGANFLRALKLIESLDSSVLHKSHLRKGDLLPIAVSINDIDLIVNVISGKLENKVIWFAGGEIERFQSFSEFFVGMIELTIEDICELENLT